MILTVGWNTPEYSPAEIVISIHYIILGLPLQKQTVVVTDRMQRGVHEYYQETGTKM